MWAVWCGVNLNSLNDGCLSWQSIKFAPCRGIFLYHHVVALGDGLISGLAQTCINDVWCSSCHPSSRNERSCCVVLWSNVIKQGLLENIKTLPTSIHRWPRNLEEIWLTLNISKKVAVCARKLKWYLLFHQWRTAAWSIMPINMLLNQTSVFKQVSLTKQCVVPSMSFSASGSAESVLVPCCDSAVILQFNMLRF